MHRTYSETRAEDRVEMAVQLMQAVHEAGGTVQVTERLPRRIDLLIKAPGGAEVRVDFDGKSLQPNVFVVTWCMSHLERDRQFANIGDVNPYHRRKASRVLYGFDSLVDRIAADIRLFVDGSGYLPT